MFLMHVMVQYDINNDTTRRSTRWVLSVETEQSSFLDGLLLVELAPVDTAVGHTEDHSRSAAATVENARNRLGVRQTVGHHPEITSRNRFETPWSSSQHPPR